MRAARRQGVLEVVRYGTGPLPRVRARAPLVQHLLRGDYKRGLHAFQGGQRHYGRFRVLKKKRGRGEETAGEPVLSTPFWGMIYADDAGVSRNAPSS